MLHHIVNGKPRINLRSETVHTFWSLRQDIANGLLTRPPPLVMYMVIGWLKNKNRNQRVTLALMYKGVTSSKYLPWVVHLEEEELRDQGFARIIGNGPIQKNVMCHGLPHYQQHSAKGAVQDLLPRLYGFLKANFLMPLHF